VKRYIIDLYRSKTINRRGVVIKRKKIIAFFLLVFIWFVAGCGPPYVTTRVSSISHQPIPLKSSIYVLPGNKSIEHKKIVMMIEKQLQAKGYQLTKLENADIVISFSAEILGTKTTTGSYNTPINIEVPELLMGTMVLSTRRTTGYKTHSYTTTSQQSEIRIQFQSGKKLRAKESETLLWEAVGKSSGSSSDIIYVAPGIIDGIFEEIGKDSDSKSYQKEIKTNSE